MLTSLSGHKLAAVVFPLPPRGLVTLVCISNHSEGRGVGRCHTCPPSNLLLLFCQSMKPELSYLAHNLCEIDKYRVETCCVIGNYYSLRSQHEKAALYFQRALKLNPRYLGAWTLMGHEYMEMKNTSAAIQAYRHAIEVNKRDYRAWYGLGQTYEILKMPFYCLYYYRRAHQLRPNDSRMLVALGECYEKLNQLVEAKKVSEGADVLRGRLGIQVAAREAGRGTNLVSTSGPPELSSSAYLESNGCGIVLRMAILSSSVMTLIPGWE